MCNVQGDIVCQLGDLDLSTFCIRQLALLSVNDRHNMSTSQRAVVYSFFKNYDRVHFCPVCAVITATLVSFVMLNDKTTVFQRVLTCAVCLGFCLTAVFAVVTGGCVRVRQRSFFMDCCTKNFCRLNVFSHHPTNSISPLKALKLYSTRNV